MRKPDVDGDADGGCRCGRGRGRRARGDRGRRRRGLGGVGGVVDRRVVAERVEQQHDRHHRDRRHGGQDRPEQRRAGPPGTVSRATRGPRRAGPALTGRPEPARTADGAAAGSPGTAPAAAARWAAGTAEAADSRAADRPGARTGAASVALYQSLHSFRGGESGPGNGAAPGMPTSVKPGPLVLGLGLGAFGLGSGAGLRVRGGLGRRSLVDDALPALGTEPRTRAAARSRICRTSGSALPLHHRPPFQLSVGERPPAAKGHRGASTDGHRADPRSIRRHRTGAAPPPPRRLAAVAPLTCADTGPGRRHQPRTQTIV